MSKAYTRAAKRRAKAAMPELVPVPKREGTGRQQRPQSAGDQRKTVLDARCKLHGVDATSANRKALSAAYSGSDAGRCLAYGRSHQQAMRLWDVWQGYCQAHRTYRTRYIGQSEDPQGASIGAAPERMETDQSHSVDLRDQDERDRDAVSTWMKWQGDLMRIERHHMAAINAARTAPEGDLWSEATPTIRGYAFVQAVVALAKVKGVDIE